MKPRIKPQIPMHRGTILLMLVCAMLGFVIGRWAGIGGLVGAALAALAFYAIWIDLRVLALEAAFADNARILRKVRLSQAPGDDHATQDADPQSLSGRVVRNVSRPRRRTRPSNKGMKLTKPCAIGASQPISCVRRHVEGGG